MSKSYQDQLEQAYKGWKLVEKQRDQAEQERNTLREQVSQLTKENETLKQQQMMDTECIERIRQHGYEQELKVSQLTRKLAEVEASRERMRDNILHCRGPLEGYEVDNDVINAVLSIIDSESLTHLDALTKKQP